MSLFKKVLTGIGLAIWLALPIFLLWQPADYFDNGAVICPSKRFFDVECPGCGMTRAVQHALHFDFSEAWHYNKGFVLVVPLLGMFYIHILGRLLGKEWFSFLKKYY